MQKSRQPSGSLTAGHLSTSTRVLVVSPMHCMEANHLFMCIRDESGLLNRAYTENTDPRRCLAIFGSHPFVDLSATLPGGSQKGTRSGRQGCKSRKVEVLFLSIACIRTDSISGACRGNDAR